MTEFIRKAVGRRVTTRNQGSISLLVLAWLVYKVEKIDSRLLALEKPPVAAVDSRQFRR